MNIVELSGGKVVRKWIDVDNLGQLKSKYGLTGPDFVLAPEDVTIGYLYDGNSFSPPPPPPPPTAAELDALAEDMAQNALQDRALGRTSARFDFETVKTLYLTIQAIENAGVTVPPAAKAFWVHPDTGQPLANKADFFALYKSVLRSELDA